MKSTQFSQFQRLFTPRDVSQSQESDKKKKSKKRKRTSFDAKKEKRETAGSPSRSTLQHVQRMLAKEEEEKKNKNAKKNINKKEEKNVLRKRHKEREADVEKNGGNHVQVADPFAETGDAFRQFARNVYYVDNEFERPLRYDRSKKTRDERKKISAERTFVDTTAAVSSTTDFDIHRTSIDFARKENDVWFNHFHRKRTQDEYMEMVGEYLSRHIDDENDDENGAESGQPTKNAFRMLTDDTLHDLGEKISSDIRTDVDALEISDDMNQLCVERDLAHIWHEYLKEDMEEAAREMLQLNKSPPSAVGSFRDALQRDMFNVMNDYRDLFLPVRSPDNQRSIIESYVLHIANHLLKSKRYEWFNELKRDIRPDYKVKDRGFHPCRILALVPFRNTAFHIVQLLSVLLPKLRNVRRQEAFELTFSELTEEKERLLKTRPKWWRYIFDGSSDDNFVLGLKLNNGQLEIMCKISEADIIIATPLGIKTEHNDSYEDMDDGDINLADDDISDDDDDDDDGDGDGDGEMKKKDNGEDYQKILSSVELCIVDQCDVIFMQNWDHMVATFELMNNMPMSMKDVDFTRIRDCFIHGYAANFRQTIMISGHTNPSINGLFNSIDFCCNVRGKIRVKNSYPGVLAGSNPRKFPITVPQVFERLECEDLDDVEDYRFRYFTEELFTRFKRSADGVFLIIVPNYIDFVRMRNFLTQEGLPFLSISENQSNHVKALKRFTERQGTFLLYTERHFYYFAPRVQLFKINQIMFYKLPQHTFTYTSMLAKAQLVYNEGYKNVRVMSLFSVFDALSLERIAGSERCKQLIQSSQDVHVIENEDSDESDDDGDESDIE